MITLFSLQVVMFLILLCCYSRNKYKSTLENLDEKEFPLKSLFLPAALLLLNSWKKRYNTGYDKSLYDKISQLKGPREAEYFLMIHWANKLAYTLLGFLLLGFFWAAASEADYIMGIFSFLVLAGLFSAPDYELAGKVKKQKAMIELEFPSFLHKLVLLLNAGLTVSGAWERALSGEKRDTPLYIALYQVSAEIRGGKPEIQAYEDMARKCRTPEITKFVTIIIQNTKKGSYELASILRNQADECWENRKHLAKRLGEEASTRMLLPMMLMFIAILMIVAAPAILAMKNI